MAGLVRYWNSFDKSIAGSVLFHGQLSNISEYIVLQRLLAGRNIEGQRKSHADETRLFGLGCIFIASKLTEILEVKYLLSLSTSTQKGPEEDFF